MVKMGKNRSPNWEKVKAQKVYSSKRTYAVL